MSDRAFQIRNAVLTVSGMVTVNVVGPLLHGVAKPVVVLGLGVLWLAAIFLHYWLGRRALDRRERRINAEFVRSWREAYLTERPTILPDRAYHRCSAERPEEQA